VPRNVAFEPVENPRLRQTIFNLWTSGRAVEGGGLEKSPFCYLTQNQTKSLCQLSDSGILSFLEFADSCLFCGK
jgi:hypothetical protein